MARIAGVDIPINKRADISLTYIYGIGRVNVMSVLKTAKIDPSKRVKDFSEEEVNRLQKIIDKEYRVEGDLRLEIQNNIKRLKEIGSYRGLRHSRNLPSRGQRTRANARTKRGKRMTIGAMKKDDRVKMANTATAEKK
ncbi:30S ribosomal protein S13 [Candidatus Microgenomates bacterium]|nr:MAG: 30S ribosomal protein S13 [Candidatus Microgenomates bacterium]